jgi:very-short-patch-repair endonuclease
MTLPEVLLWQQLRLRPGGFRFRKQHPATPYVLDFYCHEARLIVEVDGIAHDMGDMPQRNQIRDAHFKSKGLRVVRIRAADVLRDPAGTAESLVAICLSPLSPSATGGSYTSPRGGDSSGTAP